MLDGSSKALALELFDIGAIRFGEFRLKLHEMKPDAPLSPIYIDLRMLRSFPDAMDSVTELYIQLARGLVFDCYADVPTAATPIVAILSYKTRIPMITPRGGAKEHGTRSQIEGTFTKGQVALLVDDLVTTADSKLKAISVLQNDGLAVHDVVVLIDREQGGVEELEKNGYSCRAAFKLRDLVRFYLDSGKISHEQYRRTIDYLNTSMN